MVFSPGIAGLDHHITDAISHTKPAGQTRRVTTVCKTAISTISIVADELSKNHTLQELRGISSGWSVVQTQSRGRAADRPLIAMHTLFWTLFLPTSSQRASKRQLVAIRIEHVEIAFTPGRVPWDFRIKSFLLQICPKRIHIRDMEDQPTPPRHSVTSFEV